jgi:hypothetical protein
MKKECTGSAYIGVVGPETDYGEGWRSIVQIARRTGDDAPNFYSGTKGYELRQLHINKFMESHHSFLLMLDHDMTFPADTLERLRSHKLPYVSGLYMRRQYDPIAPIWFEPNPHGLWPAEPMTRDPERGKLHKLGASGWGCVLIHREVIQAVRDILKGEPEVIEDDMDMWPYDLPVMLEAVKGLRDLVNNEPDRRTLLPALAHHTKTLEAEIRPLRGNKEAVGSDIRFPFFARVAGYQLWGDPDVRCGHILNYPLTPDDFSGAGADFQTNLHKSSTKRVRKARREWREAMKAY